MSKRIPNKAKTSQSQFVEVQTRDKVEEFYSSNRESLLERCQECDNSENLMETLQNALKEVLDQNEALRSRIAELEANINKTVETIEELEQQHTKIQGNQRKQEELEKMLTNCHK